jgi:hypothetical protein
LHGGGHGVDKVTVESGLHGGQVGDPLPLDVRPEDFVKLPLESGLPPRQHATVHNGLGDGGDHVGLVPGREHRGVGGVAERSAHNPSKRPKLGNAAGQVVVIELNPREPRDGVQKGPNRLSDHERKLVSPQPSNRGREFRDGVVVVQHRPVPRPPPRAEPHPSDPLLSDLDRVSTHPLTQSDREPANLTHGFGDPVKELPPVLDKPLSPVSPTSLLISKEGEDEVAGRNDPVPLEAPSNGQGHADHVLHVDGPTPPDVPVLDRTRKRMNRPLGRVSRHHVQVTMHQQSPPRRIPSAKPREDVPPPGRTRLHVSGLVPHLLKLPAHILGGRTLPHSRSGVTSVGGIDPDELTGELNGLVLGQVNQLGHRGLPTIAGPRETG